LSEADKRSEGRANVFLTASLDAGATVAAVRIRNVSSRGALIEGTSLPAIGTRVRLLRGQLCALGELAWVSLGQAGINFTTEIKVEQWVKRVDAVGQERVDGVIAALRGSGKVPTELQGAESIASLATISAELDEICERLANAPDMSIKFGEDLLKLDSIAQSLRRLATGRSF
jgi:hypothetical protein